MKTYQYQGELAQLPVPSLEDSVGLYLECLQPLVDNASFQNTKELAEAFLKNEGPVLQEKLLKYSREIHPESWLLEYSRDIYLKMRGPVAIEGNYVLEMATLPFLQDYDYLSFAAAVAHCIGLVYLELSNETLKPMMAKDQPLCMNQFKTAFRAAKVPAKGKDKDVLFKDEDVHSMGVFYKNRFYAVRLVDSNKKVVGCGELRSALAAIYNSAEEPLEVNFNTAGFAGSERCAELLELLCPEKMSIVHSTMFNITLSNRQSSEFSLCDKLLTDTTDIWPYKACSFTVYQDKICCFNMEHTFCDALTNIYLFQHVLEEMKQLPKEPPLNKEAAQTTPVNFNLGPVHDALSGIKKEYMDLRNQIGSSVLTQEKIPLADLKAKGVHVDFYFQLAFLYAQLKAYGSSQSTHESVSVTQYYNGRTSCIRTVSKESLAFLNEGGADLLVTASKEHVRRIKAAKNFCCFIRHATGLEMMADKTDKKPALFEDPNFALFRTQKLSTSTGGNLPFMRSFFYAPQTERGLGVGYITNGDFLTVNISYYKKDTELAELFIQGLEEYFAKF